MRWDEGHIQMMTMMMMKIIGDIEWFAHLMKESLKYRFWSRYILCISNETLNQYGYYIRKR